MTLIFSDYGLELLMMNGIGAPPPPPSPMAEYKMTSIAGGYTPDTSGNGNDGTLGLFLGDTTYAPTLSSTGLVFNGSKTITLPTAALEGFGTLMVFATPTYGNQSNQLAMVTTEFAGTGRLYSLSPGDNRPISDVGDYYGSPNYGSAVPLISGSLGITLRTDGKIYLNGLPIPRFCTRDNGSILPDQTTSLTGAWIGSWFSVTNGFNGTIHYVLAYSQQLTDAQVLQIHNLIAPVVTARGVTLGYSTTLSHTLIAFEGDSQTRGFVAAVGNQGYPQKTLSLLSGTYNYLNLSLGGAASPDLVARASTQLDPILTGYSGESVLVVMIGTNGAFTSGEYSAMLSYCEARKAAGWNKLVITTGLPRNVGNSAFDAARLAFNTSIRSQSSPPWDAISDWGSDSTMGQYDQESNTTYYGDQLHPTTAGHAVGAGHLVTALNSIGIT